jgi:hypothetical protein
MTPEADKMDRRIRQWSAIVVACLIGLRLAMHVYSGPSIAFGLSIAGGVALVVGLLSLCFGHRFWQFLARLPFGLTV